MIIVHQLNSYHGNVFIWKQLLIKGLDGCDFDNILTYSHELDSASAAPRWRNQRVTFFGGTFFIHSGNSHCPCHSQEKVQRVHPALNRSGFSRLLGPKIFQLTKLSNRPASTHQVPATSWTQLSPPQALPSYALRQSTKKLRNQAGGAALLLKWYQLFASAVLFSRNVHFFIIKGQPNSTSQTLRW